MGSPRTQPGPSYRPHKPGCPMSRFLRHGKLTNPPRPFLSSSQTRVPHVSIFETWELTNPTRPFLSSSQTRVPHVSIFETWETTHDAHLPLCFVDSEVTLITGKNSHCVLYVVSGQCRNLRESHFRPVPTREVPYGTALESG